MSTLSSLRKRRGVAKRSLTNLFTKLKDLEDHRDVPTTVGQAEQLLARMQDVDKSFRVAHLDIIDSIEEDSSDLEKENEFLNQHEDDISSASLPLQALVKSDDSNTRPLSRKLSRVERHLRVTEKDLQSVGDSDGKTPLLEQY